MNITYDEWQIMAFYNPGTRTGLISELEAMRGYLDPDEADLRALTDSSLAKLRAMTDDAFAALDITPESVVF